MIYGYARVSTKGQDKYGNGKEVQEQALYAAGAVKIFYDSFTGTKLHRPELDRLLSVIQAGDTVVVTKLDRIARNTKDGIEIIDTIVNRGCSIHILNMGLFDNTPTGKLMRTVMLAFAEFERDMIVQRTSEGKAVAKNKPGFKDGRPKKEIQGFEKFLQKQKDGLISVKECCKELGISERTWYRKVQEVTP